MSGSQNGYLHIDGLSLLRVRTRSVYSFMGKIWSGRFIQTINATIGKNVGELRGNMGAIR
jgi:hypothetical protein